MNNGSGEGVVTDISLSGCYLQTVVPVIPRHLACLSSCRPSNIPRPLLWKPRSCGSYSPTGVGLEFLRLSEPAQERLQPVHTPVAARTASRGGGGQLARADGSAEVLGILFSY